MNSLAILGYLVEILAILGLNNCIDEMTSPPNSPPEPPLYTKVLNSKVILENQTKHSNALVYFDSLDRRVGTDSSGIYS